MGFGGGAQSTPAPQPVESIKAAEQSTERKSEEANRNAQLRKGIASTFSRDGSSGSSATAGTATKLGG